MQSPMALPSRQLRLLGSAALAVLLLLAFAAPTRGEVVEGAVVEEAAAIPTVPSGETGESAVPTEVEEVPAEVEEVPSEITEAVTATAAASVAAVEEANPPEVSSSVSTLSKDVASSLPASSEASTIASHVEKTLETAAASVPSAQTRHLDLPEPVPKTQGSTNSAVSPAGESPRSLGEAPSGPEPRALPTENPSFSQPLPPDTLARGWGDALTGAGQLAALAGAEALRPGKRARGSSDSVASPALSAIGPDGDKLPSSNTPPRDGGPEPGPLPAPSTTTGTGSAGSFFVPLAALLALLALAAPAIFRRPREGPDRPAPALFVCALERPG